MLVTDINKVGGRTMQKGKYYRMRKELVWGAGILICSLYERQ